MNKKSLKATVFVGIYLVFLPLMTSIAGAQLTIQQIDPVTGAVIQATSGLPAIRAEITKERDQFRQQVKEQRVEVKNQIQQGRVDLKAGITNITATGTERAVQAIQMRQNLREQIVQQREGLRVKIDKERADLKANLVKIKDKAKQVKAEEIANNINSINERKVTQYSDTIDKIQASLNKIITRTDAVAEKGKDVTAVRAAINSAQAAIDYAKSAITNQATKTYILNITTDVNLRKDVSAVRDQFNSDTTSIRLSVEEAKKSVINSAATLVGMMNQIVK